jgi:hypothetical protein
MEHVLQHSQQVKAKHICLDENLNGKVSYEDEV